LKNGLDPNLSSRHQIALHMIALMYIIFIEKEFLGHRLIVWSLDLVTNLIKLCILSVTSILDLAKHNNFKSHMIWFELCIKFQIFVPLFNYM